MSEQESSETGTQTSLFNFSGGYGAYYRVYAVNALLSIVTLGLYTAWAKVRNRRFFLGHTKLNGHGFDFTAPPVRILVSRLIVAGVLISAALLDLLITESTLLPKNTGVLSLLLLLLLPYIIVRSRAFNAKHTVYRGVRFGYDRVYLPSYKLFAKIGLPLFALILLLNRLDPDAEYINLEVDLVLANYIPYGWYIFSLLLAFVVLYVPIWLHERTRILVEQMSLGRIRFKFTARISQYYRHFLVPPVFAIVMFFVTGLLSRIVLEDYALILFLLSLYLSFLYCNAIATKLMWSSISSDSGIKVQSSLNVLTYCVFLTFVNHLLIVLTISLYLPAARVRKWKWISKSLTLVSTGDFATAATDDQFRESFSAEFMDVGDYDFGFGL